MENDTPAPIGALQVDESKLKGHVDEIRPPPIPIKPENRSRQIGIGGHANSESSVTLKRNSGHDQPEYAACANTGNISGEATTPLGNILREAMRGKEIENREQLLYRCHTVTTRDTAITHRIHRQIVTAGAGESRYKGSISSGAWGIPVSIHARIVQ